MTLEEFKAWFEGFTENISGVPNKKQWERICERVEQIDNRVTTERIYIDRYYRPYRRWYDDIWFSASSKDVSSTSVKETFSADSVAAFQTAGKAEYMSLTSR